MISAVMRVNIRNFLICFGLFLFVCVVFYFFFEFVLRFFYIAGPGWVQYMLVNDDSLCYKWAPGFEGSIRGSGFRTALKINSDGFRDYDYSQLHAGQKHVVFSVGDSMTAAIQVPIERTFSKLLQNKLGKGYFVLNQGVIGYNPSQYLFVINESIKKYNPGVVLLNFFVGNDFISKSVDFRRAQCNVKVVDGYLVNSRWDELSWFFKFRAWLSYHSVVYTFVSNAVNAQYQLRELLYGLGLVQGLPQKEDLLFSDPINPVAKEYHNTTFEILKSINHIARRNNAVLVVLIIPPPDHIFSDYLNATIKMYGLKPDFNYDYAYDSLEAFLKKEKIYFFDSRSVLLSNGENVFGSLDKHFSEFGHDVIANSTFDFLVRKKVVQQASQNIAKDTNI